MMRGRDNDPPVISHEGVTAVVKWFNPVKGFGFVQFNDGSQDAFLHVSVVQMIGHQELPEGATIVCDISHGQRGPQVASITRVESMPEPGARFEPTDGDSVVEGTVKFFNPVKGFGFVVPDDGSRDVFVSARTLERAGLMELEANQRVRMTTRVGQKGPMAQSVEVI